MGFRFRRQHQIGPYIADFACVQAFVVIEVLGSAHDSPEAQERDAYRRSVLNAAGYRVFEISNDLILHQIAEARTQIANYMNTLFLPPTGGEGPAAPGSTGAAGGGGPSKGPSDPS